MELLPQMLKRAARPYATAMIGKGHIGAYSLANLPINRGFDRHFGFLGGGEDHMTQRAQGVADLWRDHAPAYGENGTKYSCDLYGDEVVDVVTKHKEPATNPLSLSRRP